MSQSRHSTKARALRAHRRLVRAAAMAPRGQKERRLETLRAWVRAQLRRETSDHR